MGALFGVVQPGRLTALRALGQRRLIRRTATKMVALQCAPKRQERRASFQLAVDEYRVHCAATRMIVLHSSNRSIRCAPHRLPPGVDSSNMLTAMNSKVRSSRRRLVLRVLAWLLVVIGFLGAPTSRSGSFFTSSRFAMICGSLLAAQYPNSHEAWQSRLRRLRITGWMHGDSWHIGQLAGKSTFRRVIERVKPGEDIE